LYKAGGSHSILTTGLAAFNVWRLQNCVRFPHNWNPLHVLELGAE